MIKIQIDTATKKDLIELYKSKNILLEGNIIKVIDSDDDEEFEHYLDTCLEGDV